MKVLIITGELAYPLIKEVVSTSKEDIIVHIADNTQVAAFLTPRQIIKEVKTCFSDQLDDIDMILVPGLIKKGTKEITKELGIPTFKGSTDGADLAMVLNLIGSIDLSEDKPADKLIEEDGFRNQMALNAYVKTKENYTWDIIINRYISLYRSLMATLN